jgi:sulfate/thiosulfate transport system substrate-binding protein
MIASTPYAPDHSALPVVGQNLTKLCTCVVQLFDRRTGLAHRINGTPLVIYTRNPAAAVEDLLERRDPENWEARISEIADDKEHSMLTTIRLAGEITAQGLRIADHIDGRVTIETGRERLTGWPIPRSLRAVAAIAALALAGFAGNSAPLHAESLLNVSYDPTRELYREVNEAFSRAWEAAGNETPTIEVSHGGSGAQARAVIEGLQAQVVTLALASDIDKIAKEGKLPADWQSRLPHNASPYTSTIVFLVREGNPKGLKDWGDLVADGVEVITPNPKTSGGARWNYLAAWAWAEKNGQDPKEFVGKLFKNVPVLDSGARGSTTTFAQRRIGDVLLAWENEAYLALKELGEDQFDIVVPSVSVLAEPPVALVEANIKTDDQRKLAEAYLNFLYSPEGQALAFKHFYRAWDASAANPEDVARFPQLELVDIASFGGWAKVQPKHFGDGGIFDQIYVTK